MQAENADPTRFDRVTTAAFLAMVLTIGGNVVAIKYVLREPDLDPLWAAASRFFLATVIFAVIASALHAPMPRGRALIGAMLYGALSFGGFFGFVYWGLQKKLLPDFRGCCSRPTRCSRSCWRSPTVRSASGGTASQAPRSSS